MLVLKKFIEFDVKKGENFEFESILLLKFIDEFNKKLLLFWLLKLLLLFIEFVWSNVWNFL